MDRPREEVSANPLDTREIIFTSLLLLGFDPREMEDKYKISFTKDMFNLPNKKGFEVVVHFLFEKLNPALAQERFRHCWPIFDKKQEQLFRKTLSNWLTEISKEDPDANLPRIVPSLFMSPGGDKFYTLLLYFSHFVVLKTCRQSHGVRSRDILHPMTVTASNKQYTSVMGQTIEASTVTPRKKFLQETQELVDLQREWKKFASSLVKEYRSLCKKIRDLEQRIKAEEARMIAHAEASGATHGVRLRSTGMTDGEWDVLAVKRAQRVQKVRDLWQSLESCHRAQADERAVVHSIITERGKKDRLDAADLPVQVPELLLRECEQEIQRRRINNVYEGGKLDLVSLIKLWNLALRLYLEKLNEAPLPDFEGMMPSVVTQVHTQNAHLANARALRNSLGEEILPDLERSVSQLLRYHREGIEIPTRDTLVKASPGHFLGKGVGLIPPTPPVSFNPAATPMGNATPMRNASTLFKKSPTDVSTPETMTQVRQTYHKSALQKAGLAQGTPASALKEVRIPAAQSAQKPQRVSRLKGPLRYRNRSSSGRPPVQETPVTARTDSRLPSGRRMVQTTGKKKKPPSFQRPSETVKKKEHAKVNNKFDYKHRDHAPNDEMPAVERQSRTPAMDRAHSKLIDQIVDSVMSETKSSERSTPTLTPEITSNDDESPAILAVKDPIGGLGLDAFASRDKLRHSPLVQDLQSAEPSSDQASSSCRESLASQSDDGSTLVASISSQQGDREQRLSPEGVTVATLIDLDDANVQSDHKMRNSGKFNTDLNPDFAGWNATLQRVSTTWNTQQPVPSTDRFFTSSDKPPPSTNVPVYSPGSDKLGQSEMGQRDAIVVQDLLEFVEEADPIERDSPLIEEALVSDEQSHILSPPGKLERNVKDLDHDSVDQSDGGKNNVSKDSPTRPSFESPDIGLGQYRSGNNQQDISLWHLDEELPEIFQSRTPQLPERLRKKSTEMSRENSPNPNERLMDTPSEETTPSGVDQKRAHPLSAQKAYPEARKLNMTSSVEEDDSVTNSMEKEHSDKRHFRSGGSHKSVTFSEPLTEESKNEYPLELPERTQSITEETMPDIIEEDSFSSPVDYEIPQRTNSPFGSCSPPRVRSGNLFGEEYLVSSPRPPLEHTNAVDLFSMELDSSDSAEISFSMTRPIEDLLEHISPTVTPSKTPQIRRMTSKPAGGENGADTPDHTPQLQTKSTLDRMQKDTPTGPPSQEPSLSQRIASLRLAAGSLGVNGTPHHLLNGKVTKTSAEFNLLEEEESLLVPTSPVQ